jgi:hypothetical protein
MSKAVWFTFGGAIIMVALKVLFDTVGGALALFLAGALIMVLAYFDVLGREDTTAIEIFPKGPAAADKPIGEPSLSPNTPVGRLSFVHSMRSPIGPGIGNQAFMIAFRNTVMDFKYVCRGIEVRLAFTHLHSREGFTKEGWFTIFENNHAQKPVRSLSLSSNEVAWIVLTVIGIGGEVYPFSGPVEGAPLDWTINLDERERLTFGKWQIRISITSSSGDELSREIEIQAP